MEKKRLNFKKTILFTALLSQIIFSTHASLGHKSKAQQASLKPQIEIGEIGHGGSGCPIDSISNIHSPQLDKKVIFKPLEYHLKIGDSKRRIVRRSCNLSIPVKIPQGISVAFYHLNFKGSLDLEKGTSLRFSAEYFIAGKRGPKIKRTFTETKLKSFQIGPEDNTPALWSECGENVNLRINTALLLRSKGTKKGQASLKSIQIGKDLKGAIKWKKCH